MILSLIVAASENNVIGKNNQLLWRLPNDTKFFKNTTWGMPVIMGRKTYESLSGEPLPGRFNIVISRQKNWNPANEKAQVASTLEEAIQLAKQTDCKEVFIIGGGQIYAESISLADKIYMTRVHTVIEGDAFFPVIDETKWQLQSNIDFPADDKHEYAYSFQVWQRNS
ncbi:MAG: dihydrofolate reductase [Bacteroidetes bacterium]|nr:dihydrofolate reductase [Bacteroidota bacterium]MBS1934886.1 dihydrofolate reductase [Bacteroidota bacterium]